MIASIVFATFICTLTPDNKDQCETTYLSTWAGAQTYTKDQADCKEELQALFPNDVRVNNETKQYQFGGCYRVLPGQWVGLTPKAVYLQNVDDADDSFSDYRDRLETYVFECKENDPYDCTEVAE